MTPETSKMPTKRKARIAGIMAGVREWNSMFRMAPYSSWGISAMRVGAEPSTIQTTAVMMMMPAKTPPRIWRPAERGGEEEAFRMGGQDMGGWASKRARRILHLVVEQGPCQD